jgi:hypothetical protein
VSWSAAVVRSRRCGTAVYPKLCPPSITNRISQHLRRRASDRPKTLPDLMFVAIKECAEDPCTTLAKHEVVGSKPITRYDSARQFNSFPVCRGKVSPTGDARLIAPAQTPACSRDLLCSIVGVPTDTSTIAAQDPKSSMLARSSTDAEDRQSPAHRPKHRCAVPRLCAALRFSTLR